MKLTEILASFVIIAVAVIIVSVILIQMNSRSGCGCMSVSADAYRISNDSIAITYKGGPDASYVANEPFIIWINDKNATNANAIRQSGLSATLDNDAGLEAKAGSKVTITGSDLSYKTNVRVSAAWTDGTTSVILYKEV